MFASHLCNHVLRVRVYSLLTMIGFLFLLIFLFWRESSVRVTISERQFDIDRSIDNKDAHIFRVGFRYKKVPIVVSGVRGFPKPKAHKKNVHVDEKELKQESTKHGLPLAPVLLFHGITKQHHSSHTWLKAGTMKLITGLLHDAYAIDIQGQGFTKIKGRLKSEISFYKGLINHFHWQKMIVIAYGRVVDQILQLAGNNLAEFELRFEAVIFIISKPFELKHIGNFKKLTYVKVMVVCGMNIPQKQTDFLHDQVTKLQYEVDKQREKDNQHVHDPQIYEIKNAASMPHLENVVSFHKSLASFIKSVDDEF